MKTNVSTVSTASNKSSNRQSSTAGETTVTVLLAFAFLVVVMGLSYLFTSGAR